MAATLKIHSVKKKTTPKTEPKTLAKRRKPTTKQLTPQQQRQLRSQEAVILKGEQAFLATARAIRTIEANKLWVEFRSINAYLLNKWDFSPQEASRYKIAGQVLEILEKGGCKRLPTNEAQCRELGVMSQPDHQSEVWKEVSRKEKVTAALIRNTAIEKGFIAKAELAEKIDLMTPQVGAVGRLTQVAQALVQLEIDDADKEAAKKEIEHIEKLIAALKEKLR